MKRPSKEDIMKAIREALMDKNTIDGREPESGKGTTFRMPEEDMVISFARQFTDRGGTMYYCGDEEEILQRLVDIQSAHGNAVYGCCNENLAQFLNHMGIGDAFAATPEKEYYLGAMLCDGLEAWNGNIVLSDKQGLGTAFASLPAVTVVLAFTSQIEPDWESLDSRLKDTYPTFPEQLLFVDPACDDIQSRNLELILLLVDDQ